MHGKSIARITFSGESSYQIMTIKSDGLRSLALSATHHGDHDQFWITETVNGREVARYNPRLVETIVWADRLNASLRERTNMTNHSPGPWTLSRDPRPHMEWNITVVRQDNPNLAVCFMTSDGPNEANAKLIAAAPELLKALQDILEVTADCGGYEACQKDDFSAARAAIAKATA